MSNFQPLEVDMILLYIVARSYDPQKAEEMLRKVQLTILSDSLIVIK